MRGFLGSPYSNVRGRALASRLWSPAASDIPPAGEKLPARRFVAEPAAADGGLGNEAEGFLNREALEYSLILRQTLNNAGRQLLDALLARNWVENLRVLCRFPSKENAPLPLPVVPGSTVLPSPGSWESLDELARALPSGRYRDLLRAAAKKGTSLDPAGLDDSVLACYWQGVADRIAFLPAWNRAQVRELLGGRADLDLFRMLWRLRPKEDALQGRDIPFPALGLGARLKQKHGTATLRRHQIRRRFPGLLDLSREDDDRGGELEMELARSFRRHLRQQLRAPPFGMQGVLSTVLLKELEQRDRKGLLGMERYRLPPAVIDELLSNPAR